MSKHRWTYPQIHFVAKLWNKNWSRRMIADAVNEHFGIALSDWAVGACARRNRALMPAKSRADVRVAIGRGVALSRALRT